MGRVFQFVLMMGVLCLGFAAGGAPAADRPQKSGDAEGPRIGLSAPLFSPLFSRFPVALVNDDPITLKEFSVALGSVHAGRAEEKTGAKKDYTKVLMRLVNTKLIVQEAQSIGLDELPEVKKMVEVFSKATLRELLRERQVQDAQPDEALVEKLYREAVQEFKIQSVLFLKEADARDLEAKIKAGASFDEAAARAIADKTARGDLEGKYVKREDLQPQVVQVVSAMQAGSVSPRIPMQPGFAFIKLEEIRFPENPAAREDAREEALGRKKIQILTEYNQTLSRKYLKFNKKRVDSLDFDSPTPGFEKLLRDQRVLVEVKGGKPVTVADLAQALQEKFFHSPEKAAQKKRITRKKYDVLEELLGKRVLGLEALHQGIDKTEEYANRVKDYEQSLLFATFLQNVIAPEIKPGEDELKRSYEQHRDEYLAPARMKLFSLVFGRQAEAEKALDSLRKGAEFRWVKENADGQVSDKARGVRFDGDVQTQMDLPDDVNKALAGAKAGEFRLVPAADKTVSVVFVQEVIPASRQPYDQVRELVQRKVVNDMLNTAIEAWAEKLKKASEVTVYLTDVKH